MNWIKLITGFIISSVTALMLLDYWIFKYAQGLADIGAGFLIGLDMLGLYMISIAYAVKPLPPPKPKERCEHDWHQSRYSSADYPEEACVLCDAKRGAKK